MLAGQRKHSGHAHFFVGSKKCRLNPQESGLCVSVQGSRESSGSRRELYTLISLFCRTRRKHSTL